MSASSGFRDILPLELRCYFLYFLSFSLSISWQKHGFSIFSAPFPLELHLSFKNFRVEYSSFETS